jgi:hypothetical protein
MKGYSSKPIRVMELVEGGPDCATGGRNELTG